MPDHLQRTDDWLRLSRSGLFEVEDLPGKITLRRVSPGWKQVGWWQLIALGAPVIGAISDHNGTMEDAHIGAFCGGFFSLVFLFCLILPGRYRLGKYADRVVFTPTEVHLYKGARRHRILDRHGLQQIVPDQDHHGLRYHMFVSDTDWVSAFAMSDPTEQTLMNNILMVAFNQPLHLDLLTVSRGTTAAPNISGLWPAAGTQLRANPTTTAPATKTAVAGRGRSGSKSA